MSAMSEVAASLLEVLGRTRNHARFVPELARLLAASQGDLEQALGELETEGRVLVREQYCPDPHLEGMDLRIVALVDSGSAGDGLAAANDSIESTWQRWLGEYLANHRCT
jgi:hypothetical protein